MITLSTFTTNQRKLLLLTLFAFAFLFFVSSAGINCSNDGSHFALAKSIYYNHTTEIKPFFGYVKCCDFAEKNGKIYSDRLPGNALLMLPLLAYSNLLKLIGLPYLGQKFETDIVAISLLPNVCALLSLVILFLLFTQSGFGFSISFISTVIYGLGTLHWLEATHAFSHMPSLLFVVAAIYVTFSVKDFVRNQNLVYTMAALIGFSTLIELQNILFIGPVFIYFFVTMNPADRINYKDWLPVFIKSLIIAGFFVGCLLFYNFLTFNELILKSNTYNPNFPEEKTFSESLGGDFVAGLGKLLIDFSNPDLYYNWNEGKNNDIPGLLVTSPILWISMAGFLLFFKKASYKALLFITLISISVIIAALHKTTLTRHIFTILPFFFFPFAYVLERVWFSKKYKLPGLIVIGCLTLISIMRIYYVTATYWGYGGRDFFKFKTELPFFLAFYIPVLAIALFWRKKLNRSYEKTIASSQL
ncbi:hypothetical protein L0657_12770 [Dyadobacter sp. CY345]|uniref:hypothetical protein n=1 Tax=Dyadobacter sp. CY345 TaxID=2909335 RepID=UPI001F27E944|nr:hypothetical protein [Dyadobacter sp. CY345]MCF2444832.1 hypothetical protein [Dyadobacter sp. CY345]